MKKNALWMMGIAIAVAVSMLGVSAWAGESCCPKESKCPVAGAKEGKAAACAQECDVEVTGKVMVKTKEVDGKEVKLVYIKADSLEGKDCCKEGCSAKGAKLKVVGDLTAEVEKLDGKQVVAKGVCKQCKELEVASVTEKTEAK